MIAPAIAVFALFCIDTLLNWTGNLFNKQKLADNSKPLLMPLLALTAVLLLLPTDCPRTVIMTMVVALAFHTAGDILLISDRQIHFLLGAACFMVGHIFYLTLFAPAFANVGAVFFIVMAVVIVAFGTVLFLGLKKEGLAMALGVPVYAAVLLTVAFAGAAGVTGGYTTVNALCVLIGGILFVTSDGLLALSNFAVKFPGYKFWVMFTYVVAEVFLALGVVLPYLKK